jgi:hypothetical protein
MGALVSLGDSFSCGEGVGLNLAPEQIWVDRLARGLGLELVQLAQAGATVGDVRRLQVPLAEHRGLGAVASVFTGPNDAFRPHFDPHELCRSYLEILARLGADGAVVLVGRWHDPLRLYPLPNRWRRGVLARVADINTAIDAAVASVRTRGVRVAILDLEVEQSLARREAWAVDRIHPSESGHRDIALAARRVLSTELVETEPSSLGDSPRGGSAADSPVEPVDGSVCEDVAPSGWSELRWWVCHGTPWMVARLGQLAIPVSQLALGRAERTTLHDGDVASGEPSTGRLLARVE